MLALLWVVPAHSQGVRQSAGDNGVKLGDGRLHPFGSVRTHYVTNPGRLPSGASSDLNVSDGMLEPTAGLEYILDSGKNEVKFKGDGAWRQYFGEASKLNSFAGGVDLKAAFFRERPVEFRTSGSYTYQTTPNNQTVSQMLFSHNFAAGAGATFRPGGGALSLSADFGFFQQEFDDADPFGLGQTISNPNILNNQRLTPTLRAGWRFLPKTSIFVESSFAFVDYTDPSSLNRDSGILETYLGLSGALTPRLSTTLKAGYGDTFIEGDRFRSVIGLAELGFAYTSTGQLRVGIHRRVDPTPLFGYVGSNQAYLKLDHGFGKVNLGVGVDYSYLNYGNTTNTQSIFIEDGGRRVDNTVNAELSLSYKMTSWLTVALSDKLEFRDSNATLGGAGLGGLNAGYVSNDLFLSLSARY